MRGGSSLVSRTTIAAVIFDLDGTVLDSEPSYGESDRRFLARWGIEYSEELNAAMIGKGTLASLEEFERRFPSSPLHALTMDERLRLKDEAYLAIASESVLPFPGVAAFIAELAAAGVPMAIASGSSPTVIDATLGFTGLLRYFPLRVSAGEVAQGKPAPDIFLEAARRLGIKPRDCLVLEDSVYGVLAAKAAGMDCIALPHPDHEGQDEFKLADLRVPGGASSFKAAMAYDRWDFAGVGPTLK